MKNPFEDRDLSVQLKWPTLSWSSLNAFESYDKGKWYSQYVLGIRSASNANMDAGREIGERLATDPTYLPEVPRPEIYEQELRGKLGKIQLVGHLDGWSPKKKELLEYKTTVNGNKWNLDSVAEHGQIDFYCLLIWLNFKIPPEKLKISLTSIPVRETGHFKVELDKTQKIRTIPTTRTMAQILMFGARIKAIHTQMQKFVDSQPAIE